MAPAMFPLTGGGIGAGPVIVVNWGSTPVKLQALDVQPAPYPSMSQALLALFIDGASLETTQLSNAFIFGDDFNLDNFIGTPDQLAVVRMNASAAGINYDAVSSLARFLANFRDPLTAQADIGANLPFAGSFATFAVLAGAEAALQSVQLS